MGGFIAFMLIVGRRLFPWILWQVARTGSRELFTLCVVAAAVSIAYGAAYIFEVSFALGAFFAGMVLRESEFSQRAATDTLPLQDAFAVLFFVSVGMLLDPLVLVKQPGMVAATVAIIVLGKALAAFALVLAFRYPVATALTVAASLAQIGEFSFILADLGISLGLMPKEGASLIVAGAMISIAINPIVFRFTAMTAQWLERRQGAAGDAEAADDPLAKLPMAPGGAPPSQHVVLVGHGRVGQRIAAALTERGLPFVVADLDRERVAGLRATNVPAICGDATHAQVLAQAHVRDARAFVIATSETVQARAMAESARTLNPAIEVLVRSHNAEEAQLLEQDGTGKVFVGEHELANSMARHLFDVFDNQMYEPNKKETAT